MTLLRSVRAALSALLAGALLLPLCSRAFAGEVVDLDRPPAGDWLRENWFELRVGPARVGWMRRALVRTSWGEEPAIAREAEIHVNVAGTGNTYHALTRTVFQAGGEQLLVGVESSVESQARSHVRKLRREGDTFVVHTRIASRDVDGAVAAIDVRLSDELALERAVAAWRAAPADREEVSITATGLDIDRLRPSRQVLRIRRDEQAADGAAVTVRTGDGAERWSAPFAADSLGVVDGDLFAGIRVHRSTQEAAQAERDLVTLVAAARVPLSGDVGDPATVKEIDILARPGSEELLKTCGRQTASALPDGRVRLHVSRDLDPPPLMRVELGPSLAATPLLDHTNPELERVLNGELRGISMPALKVKRLLEFVSRRIEYTVVLGDVPASETLALRRGDCSESARLFVALCRGARIPARLVHGLLWTARGGGGLGLHAWAEVALDDHWREVDPVSGTMPAHAVRIRLPDGAADLAALRGLGLEIESIVRD